MCPGKHRQSPWHLSHLRPGLGAALTRGRGLASKGAGGARCKLSPAQLRELATLLDAGPAVQGWDEDQCWTPARITEVAWRRFGVEYTLAGMDLLQSPPSEIF
jgi:transposase